MYIDYLKVKSVQLVCHVFFIAVLDKASNDVCQSDCFQTKSSLSLIAKETALKKTGGKLIAFANNASSQTFVPP